jgi:AcrR family transcriptional regulator
MDRRQRRSRASIMKAFMQLLSEKDYAHITVQEIIDAADVGRTTFYAHFETKDALLETFCEELFSHAFAAHLSNEPTHDFSHQKSLETRITHVLYHLADDMDALRGIMSEGNDSVFARIFKRYLADVFAESELVEAEGVPQDYLINHAVCDFMEAVRWWARNPSYTPEDISRFFFITALPQAN